MEKKEQGQDNVDLLNRVAMWIKTEGVDISGYEFPNESDSGAPSIPAVSSLADSIDTSLTVPRQVSANKVREKQNNSAGVDNNRYIMNRRLGHDSDIETKPYQCESCNKRFTRSSNLKVHVLSHTGVKDFGCHICSRRFYSKSNLKVHFLVHTGQKNFACDICDKRFVRKSQRDGHRLSTHGRHANHACGVQDAELGAKPFQCNSCSKRFTRSNNLKAHVLSHTGVKDFSCHLCSRRFFSKYNLKVHLLVHTGQKNFACDVCGQRFVRKSQRDGHRLSKHGGPMSHACVACDKTFACAGYLRKHAATVHASAKDWACPECDRRFSLKSSRDRHLLAHGGEKNHVCVVCRKAFVRASYLRKHANAVHRERGTVA